MDAVKLKISEIADLKGGLSIGNYGHRVHVAEIAPTEADVNYYLGTVWIDKAAGDAWLLVNVDEAKATWYKVVTPEFTDVYTVVRNIEAVFEETANKAESAEATANAVKASADAGEFDGFDPIVELSAVEGGVEMKVTDAQGEKSEVIPRGPQGVSGTIEVVEVKTGVAGSDVVIENTGTAENAKLSITIPRGAQGYGLTVKGKYPSYDEFIAAQPTGAEGDNWQVTTDEGDLIYTWNALTGEWQSLGELRGADGYHFIPNVENGIISFTNNGDLDNPEPYDLLADTKEFITKQGYATGEEIDQRINEMLNKLITDAY